MSWPGRREPSIIKFGDIMVIIKLNRFLLNQQLGLSYTSSRCHASVEHKANLQNAIGSNNS